MPLSNPLIKDIDRAINQIKSNDEPKYQTAQHSQIQSRLLAKLPLEVLESTIRYVIGEDLVPFSRSGQTPLFNYRDVDDVFQIGNEKPRRPNWKRIDNSNGLVLRYTTNCKYGSRTSNYADHKGLLRTCQIIHRLVSSILYETTLFSILSWAMPGLGAGLGTKGRMLENLPIPVWNIRNVQLGQEGGPCALVLAPTLRLVILKATKLQNLRISYRELLNCWIPVVCHDWKIEYEFLHLLCRLQGLHKFEMSLLPAAPRSPSSIEALTKGYANFAIVKAPPRTPEDTVERRVHMVLNYVLQAFICGGIRRTLKPGQELKTIVAGAQELFGQLVSCPEVFSQGAELNIPQRLEVSARES